MAKKPDKRKPDDPEQSKRFVETARDVEAVDDARLFEELISRLSPKKPKHEIKTQGKA